MGTLGVGVWTATWRRFVSVALLVTAIAMLWTAPTWAQVGRRGPPTDRGGSEAAGGVSAEELQRLFDAYTLMQAQESLQLSDEQYPRFLARLRALQEVRRRAQIDRTRALQQLRRLVQERRGSAADDRILEQLKALREASERTGAEIARAIDAIDEVLDPSQQARLRLFEEQMERRKLELLLRARQGNRARLRR